MNLRFFITIIIILSSLGILALGTSSTSQDASILIIDLTEAVNAPDKFEGKNLRMRGFVKAGSILRHSKDKAEFIMEQGEHSLPVYYSGATQLPDTFTDGAPIRADGYIHSDHTFLANRIEAKCTSKYETPHAK